MTDKELLKVVGEPSYWLTDTGVFSSKDLAIQYSGNKPPIPLYTSDQLQDDRAILSNCSMWANERIKELKKFLEDANLGAQRNALINQSLAQQLTAERTISDKLEDALAHYAAEGWTAITVLAEVAAIRKETK